PSHAIREAFEHPERIDDLFLERGVAKVTPRLGLLAGLEPLTELVMPAEEAVMQLLTELLQRYRYVVVDLPAVAALAFPRVLHAPSTILLVSDGTLVSAREVGRWRDVIGGNTPERSTLHILNKKGADGGLPDNELKRAFATPPEIVIPYDRDVARSSILGAAAVGKSSVIRRGMGAISRDLAGAVAEEAVPFWKRIFR
ncbi:MAG: CpaE family protein, partial [Alphaproteobacteria bacterium]